jgi:hypothetical protein
MRRLLVSLALLLAATATIWVTASPGAAAPSARAAQIACPDLSPCCPVPPDVATGSPAQATDCCLGPTTTVSCCPIADCCVTTACCPTASTCCTSSCPTGDLTIGASPDPSVSGRKVVISGVLSASPAAGAQVDLWRERAGQSTFQQVAQTTTNTSGDYSFTRGAGSVQVDQAWYVTSGTLRSGTIDQLVKAVVSLVPSSRSMIAGQSVVLSGHVTPSHAGEVVLIEQSHAGGWRVIARPRLSKSSNYTFSHRLTHTGRTKLRAVLGADTRNVQSFSPVLTLTVRS